MYGMYSMVKESNISNLESFFIELQLELSGKNREEVILQITDDMRDELYKIDKMSIDD